VVNLRPEGDHPDRARVLAGLPPVPRSCSGSPPMPVSWPPPAAERHRRGEPASRPMGPCNPFRHRQQGPYA